MVTQYGQAGTLELECQAKVAAVVFSAGGICHHVERITGNEIVLSVFHAALQHGGKLAFARTVVAFFPVCRQAQGERRRSSPTVLAS